MSPKAIILILSIIAFAVINAKFLRDDPEYRKQSAEQKMFKDPLGIHRFKRQPKKMAILTGVLVGPIFVYLAFTFLATG